MDILNTISDKTAINDTLNALLTPTICHLHVSDGTTRIIRLSEYFEFIAPYLTFAIQSPTLPSMLPYMLYVTLIYVNIPERIFYKF